MTLKLVLHSSLFHWVINSTMTTSKEEIFISYSELNTWTCIFHGLGINACYTRWLSLKFILMNTINRPKYVDDVCGCCCWWSWWTLSQLSDPLLRDTARRVLAGYENQNKLFCNWNKLTKVGLRGNEQCRIIYSPEFFLDAALLTHATVMFCGSACCSSCASSLVRFDVKPVRNQVSIQTGKRWTN